MATRPAPSTGPAPAVSFRSARASRSVAESVVEEIESTIARQGLGAGYRLGTKHELCERFQVAPATLSEALRVLRGHGMVEVRPGPGGGIFVADQPPLLRLAHNVRRLRREGATVNDCVEVLDSLDEAVVRDAAAHRTETDLDDLDALTARLGEVWHLPAEGMHVNWQLHRRIAQITPNVVLRTFYQNLVDFIEGEARSEPELDVPGFSAGSAERLQVHLDLVAAIRSRDDADIAEALRRHHSIPNDEPQ